jgi:acyl-coenzyme A thioesterase 13
MSASPLHLHFQSLIDSPIGMHNATGFTAWLQGTIRKVEHGSIALEVTVRAEMCNPVGTLHGGIHAAIMDEVIGMTVAAMGNESHFVTLNLTTDIFRTAKAGDIVTATSQVVKSGRKAIHIIASLHGADGKELSRSTQNMMAV